MTQATTTAEPLAYRMRPLKLDDFVGQEEIVGEGTALRTAIEKDQLGSIILAGPPGTGKTTLARIIAEQTAATIVSLNAVTSGVKELKAVCEEASRLKETFHTRTILFIDEIHRFNTSQQDALLPYVESGTVTLIGATTQNPYFDVNPALVSRSRVCLLKPLTTDQLLLILKRALEDDRGYEGQVRISAEALMHIAIISNGDARVALNALELTVLTAGKKVTTEEVKRLFVERHKRYDKKGEDHYNTISAFIKTLRGSDPDAALLWLFGMIERGEDPRFLWRRMAIFASEDIGNADPRALQIVVAGWQAFELVGLPEGEYFLAHACVYLAQAPKSDGIKKAMGGAKQALKTVPTLDVPNHLRNAPLKGMKDQGYSQGYQYPHDVQEGVVAANYFPIGVTPQRFYEPTDRGFEVEVGERLGKIRAILKTA